MVDRQQKNQSLKGRKNICFGDVFLLFLWRNMRYDSEIKLQQAFNTVISLTYNSELKSLFSLDEYKKK